MSAAFELERGRHYLEAKVVELASDPEGMATKKKLLHRWSAKDDSRAGQQEKQVTNIIVLSSLSPILVSGFVGMLMLGSG